jgi:hypothetical protein
VKTWLSVWWLAGIVACGARSQLDVDAAEATDAGDETQLRESSTDSPTAACTFDDAGAFRCGDGSCERVGEMCSEVVGGPPPGVDILSCKPLAPDCCACSCATFDPKTCFCNDDGGVHVTCVVP